jgi:hypothetical protein
MSGEVRLRRGRVTALSASLLVTATAALGGLGILPTGTSPSYAADRSATSSTPSGRDSSPSGDALSLAAEGSASSGATGTTGAGEAGVIAVPPDSGEGRRVVFDMSDQRVWLVREDESVARTYLVSGSIYDNLDAGSYEVYSKSMDATGIEDSGTMRFMVRFAYGANAAIGFHDIPVDEGKRVQGLDDLGTPTSHGCIRQARPDARALWRFAPVGTQVVVTD